MCIYIHTHTRTEEHRGNMPTQLGQDIDGTSDLMFLIIVKRKSLDISTTVESYPNSKSRLIRGLEKWLSKLGQCQLPTWPNKFHFHRYFASNLIYIYIYVCVYMYMYKDIRVPIFQSDFVRSLIKSELVFMKMQLSFL